MEELIFDDELPSRLIVDFSVDEKYSNCCSTYNKCSFIKKVLSAIPEKNKHFTPIELHFYIDYAFDLEDKVIEAVFTDLKKDLHTGINTLKRLKKCPKCAYKTPL